MFMEELNKHRIIPSVTSSNSSSTRKKRDNNSLLNVLIDIDECTTAVQKCHGVANCYNNEGSFTCECREGYTGDGVSNCDPVGESA